jgi:signal transduction histidine kinase
MKAAPRSLERECVHRLRLHLENASERTLHSAYELGRIALASDIGVLDLGALILRAMLVVLPRVQPATQGLQRQAIESFVLEALSPFEMSHRGAREANLALRRMDEVRENEIRRIAHELHDSAGQMLASVHLALDDLARDLEPRSRPGLERAKVLLVRAEEQLRRLSHEFLPPMLDDLGLGPALEYLGDVVSRRTGLPITVRIALPNRLPAPFEITLYRIVQEALANVTRHARAAHATVTVEARETDVLCRIEDDGVGFDPGPKGRARLAVGIGLKGIRERASRLGGTLEIQSQKGQGTRLALAIPQEADHVVARADRR